MKRLCWIVIVPLGLSIMGMAGADETPLISGQRIEPNIYKALVDQGYLPCKPEMTDMELVKKFNLDLPQMAAVKSAVEKKDTKALYKALGDYLNTKLPPINVQPTGKPASNAAAADVWLADEYEYLGVKYKLGDKIDWWSCYLPETTHRGDAEVGFVTVGVWGHPLSQAYGESGDPKYADILLKFSRSLYHNCRPFSRVEWYGDNGVFLGPWHGLWVSSRIWPGYLTGVYKAIGAYSGTTDADRVLFLKMFWEHSDVCYKLIAKPRNDNHELHVMIALRDMVKTFPEFLDKNLWLQRMGERFVTNMKACMLEDGGFNERQGYILGYGKSYMDAYEEMRNLGAPMSEEFKQITEKAAEFNIWMLAPTLEFCLFGTGGLGPFESIVQKSAKVFPERTDFAYVASEGKEGNAPGGVARALWHIGWLTMRSDWSREAIYMAMNYNGSHYENQSDGTWSNLLSFGLWANGWPYMTDSGTTAAYSEKEFAEWNMRTQSNNTVLVDEDTQDHVTNGGRLETWSSLPHDGPGFTYLAAESAAYRKFGVTHRRAVLFIRPHYWLVYDILTGDGKPHKYNWQGHFQPADIKIDPVTRVTTATPDGVKPLWVIPARPKTFNLVQKTGAIISRTYDSSIKMPLTPTRKMVPYISLEKSNMVEPASFAVLLYPSTTETKQPTMESLEVKDKTSLVPDAQAIGIRVRQSTSDDILAMAKSPSSRQYGSKKDGLITDGESAYIRRTGGNVTEAGLVQGTFLEYQGKRVIEAGKDITAVHLLFADEEIQVSTEGSGVVNLTLDREMKVTINRKSIQGKAPKGPITLNVGAPGKITLSEPSYATSPADIKKALGVPRPLACKDMVAVSWQSSVPADATVEYCKEGVEDWIRSVNPELLSNHLFVLSNLENGKRYRLRITCRSADGRIGKLETNYTHKESR